jgi:VanZ family protein
MAWVALIQLTSGDTFAADNTRTWLTVLLSFFFRDVSAPTVEVIHVIVRKTAHVVEYALLGTLSHRAFLGTSRRTGARIVAAALAVALLCSLIDEGRQVLASSRTGSLRDVVIDGVGIIAGVAAHAMGPRFGWLQRTDMRQGWLVDARENEYH